MSLNYSKDQPATPKPVTVQVDRTLLLALQPGDVVLLETDRSDLSEQDVDAIKRQWRAAVGDANKVVVLAGLRAKVLRP